MTSTRDRRQRMVDRQIAARGITDARTLEAMHSVPREVFVTKGLEEFAYEDAPLPIDESQTISQPYVVAFMIEALQPRAGDRALEIGAGSGYAAAVLGRVVSEVYAIERFSSLAQQARQRMRDLGYDNVHVMCGDGTLGWAEGAPYDAILVSAGGPDVPESLRSQLAIGGRLVIPVGSTPNTQELLRIRRTGEHAYEEESLGEVRFVPLIGTEGWAQNGLAMSHHRAPRRLRIARQESAKISALIAENAEPIQSIGTTDLNSLLERIGDARVVLIGEATHGTSEFYRMRARITQNLIEHGEFNIVAIEGDWPDTRAVDAYVRGQDSPDIPTLREPAFSRFPTWMWRNAETTSFIDWLTLHNTELDPANKVSFNGLDLYSLNNSIGAVLAYLDRVDAVAAQSARIRYACFSPWETDPATYGRAAVSGRLHDCENEAVATLTKLLEHRMGYLADDGESFFDAERNARVIREAERYYRAMYTSSCESWNLRDRHMFDTLMALLEHRGPDSKAVVWAHNSHAGDAAATEIATRGELNIGQLARETFGDNAYMIGFGTHQGTVAAASNWDEPMQSMDVRPSHEDSYERLCHDSNIPAFLLHLREPEQSSLRAELLDQRLERAIGVIYRPETELLSHYFQASLPAQFDEYIWFDKTSAVHPLGPTPQSIGEMPDTWPFGL